MSTALASGLAACARRQASFALGSGETFTGHLRFDLQPDSTRNTARLCHHWRVDNRGSSDRPRGDQHRGWMRSDLGPAEAMKGGVAVRILHVAETYVRSGVGRVVDQIASITPEHEHFLIWSNDTTAEPIVSSSFQAHREMRDGFTRRIDDVRRFTSEIGPDVIHAHSSWAGVYVRAMRQSVPVIYQPHCYKFDDPTLHWAARAAVRIAETLMSHRTTCTVILSPHERSLAELVSPRSAWIAMIPNVPHVPGGQQPIAAELDPDEDVVMSGRLCKQKDPGFFLDVANALREIRPGTRLRWIGDGESVWRERLLEADIEVTGWVDGGQLAAELARPAVYFHCASYEGFPLSVLDAAASGRPVIVRDIPPFHGSPLVRVKTAEGAARALADALTGGPVRAQAIAGTMQVLETMNNEAQRDSLLKMYSQLDASTN